ncbi:glycine cleavage system aminomethyltransferase GcvT [Paenibacillus pasadenensis]|uniref:glycine cleavage system aminomethyltransferase GcvT n=1 Tax=Paenibacillus pasadenensis TaxID=217090 RepID=UPI0020422DD5|nr:glycine cleavage system aminomethyltransferase GcvT [Paenibacillus pasadenensis]MCM3750321.1 glycine cleavage system aminomethyltransferase GcvT [Paenibacillus pasadenensis]
MANLRTTPLYPLYREYGEPRCIDFGGWELPVQFSGIIREHEAVRMRAGLFDVSHMGEFIVTGQFAADFLQGVTTNDIRRLKDGMAQYTLMCYPDGGVVDDLLVYRISEDQYMLVVNASNIGKDFDWLQEHLIGDVTIEDRSDVTALLALQGPLSAEILSRCTDAPFASLPPFHFLRAVEVCGVRTLLSRTGYTGEDGFELYVPAEDAAPLWRGLMAAGSPLGLEPAGLGARDTLRLEAKLPLYGQELSSGISPLEAGLGMFVKLDSGEFIGRGVLAAQKSAGIPRRLVGVELLERGIPRTHYPVFCGETQIGEITSGTQSPTLKRNLGLALIQAEYAAAGTELEVEIRGKRLKAAVVPAPFYKKTRLPLSPDKE